MAESSRSADAPVTRAVDLARRSLSIEPAGLLTDFDGTVSAIVADPMRATLVDGASSALAALSERLAVVAIVTGRAPADARSMAGVPGIVIAGNHGTEWLEPGSDEPTAPPGASSLRPALDAILARVPALDGVVVEHKGSTASVHFRNAPDPAEAERRILRSIGDVEEHGFHIGRGRMIVEIRATGLGDKGSAVRAIAARHRLRGMVVMGDDITDLDMFRAAAELRDAGAVRATIIGVAGAHGEAAPEVAAAADVVLSAPGEVAALLVELASDEIG